MKIHDCRQGTSEWLALRAGIPTSSEFSKIVTPKTAEPSKQADGYLHSLIAERLMGHPSEQFISMWMQRGKELEASAVSYYQNIYEVDTTPIGFITNDEGTVGTSPDRLVNADGLLEIKVPKESTQINYLLNHQLEDEYRPQLQGQLWITGRQWVDILAWHPELPPAFMRVDRDESYIRRTLEPAVNEFAKVLEARYQFLLKNGRRDKDAPPPPSLEALLKESLIAISKQ